jgi:hypothetical protein
MKVSRKSSRWRGRSMFYKVELCGLFIRMIYKRWPTYFFQTLINYFKVVCSFNLNWKIIISRQIDKYQCEKYSLVKEKKMLESGRKWFMFVTLINRLKKGVRMGKAKRDTAL